MLVCLVALASHAPSLSLPSLVSNSLPLCSSFEDPQTSQLMRAVSMMKVQRMKMMMVRYGEEQDQNEKPLPTADDGQLRPEANPRTASLEQGGPEP